jgi:hypothetical protein
MPCGALRPTRSYNHLSAEGVEVVATKLKENFTLLGIHVAGNPCGLDQECFILPKGHDTGSASASTTPHDRIMYYPKTTFNADCWLCGRCVASLLSSSNRPLQVTRHRCSHCPPPWLGLVRLFHGGLGMINCNVCFMGMFEGGAR